MGLSWQSREPKYRLRMDKEKEEEEGQPGPGIYNQFAVTYLSVSEQSHGNAVQAPLMLSTSL